MSFEDGKNIQLEVWLPDDIPINIVNELISVGFVKCSDGFYIPEESYELFCSMASPYEVSIFQRFEGMEISLEVRQNMILDMLNDLKAAGVHGIDTWLKKVSPYMSE